jgi:Transposase
MARTDRFANLTRIGIDEISYTRGHRYLTVVVDHDSRRLIWAAPGRDKATLNTLFDELGPDRCAAITHVSADAADWIADVVAVRCPAAGPVRRCFSYQRVDTGRRRRPLPAGCWMAREEGHDQLHRIEFLPCFDSESALSCSSRSRLFRRSRASSLTVQARHWSSLMVRSQHRAATLLERDSQDESYALAPGGPAVESAMPTLRAVTGVNFISTSVVSLTLQS